MSKKKKHQHDEEHADESWLLPYSDMLTLLLALFIIMFAMSNVDKQKFDKLSDEFNAILVGGGGIFNGIARPEYSTSKISYSMPEPGKITPGPSSVDSSSASSMSGETKNPIINTATEEEMMVEIKKSIEAEIKKSGYSKDVKVVLNNEGFEISIQASVLFRSGEANVLQSVAPLLLQISGMLSSVDNDIKIVGHTDNIPIKTSTFESNWELSAIRAINVMEFLVHRGGLDPDRFSIQGFGEYSPKYDNSTEEGRAKNRRVEIFLIRKFKVAGETTKSGIASSSISASQK